MTTIAVLRAGERDLPALLQIWAESVAATHSFVLREDLAALRLVMPMYLRRMPEIWQVVEGGRRAGFLACCGSSVEMLFMAPAFFGRGHGSRLLRHAASLHGALQVAVNCANAGALKFYLRNSFQICGYSSHDAQGREYPLFFMEREKVV